MQQVSRRRNASSGNREFAFTNPGVEGKSAERDRRDERRPLHRVAVAALTRCRRRHRLKREVELVDVDQPTLRALGARLVSALPPRREWRCRSDWLARSWRRSDSSWRRRCSRSGWGESRPDPGIRADAPVILGGFALVALTVAVIAFGVAWRVACCEAERWPNAPGVGRTTAGSARRRRSRWVSACTRTVKLEGASGRGRGVRGAGRGRRARLLGFARPPGVDATPTAGPGTCPPATSGEQRRRL
jgi:hypothetical protein